MTLKTAVMAAGLAPPYRLFPDYFTAPDLDEEEAAAGEGAAWDTSDVDWVMPSDGEDPEETLRLLEAMGANTGILLGDDEEFVPVPFPGEENLPTGDVDREWS